MSVFDCVCWCDRALRLDYMQSGGSDPAVLAQMHDMQAEAHTLEQQAQSGADNKGRRKSECQSCMVLHWGMEDVTFGALVPP